MINSPCFLNRALSNLIDANKKCFFRLSTGGSVNLAPICPRANCRILSGSSYSVQLYPINLRPHICIPWNKCFTEPTGSPGRDYLPNRFFSSISIDFAVILHSSKHFDRPSPAWRFQWDFPPWQTIRNWLRQISFLFFATNA